MNRFVNSIDKSVRRDPSVSSPILVPTNTLTTIFPDMTKSVGEIASRTVQNTGTNPVYIGIGFNPDIQTYSILLPPSAGNGTLSDIVRINSAEEVIAFIPTSAGGTSTIAAVQLIRNDPSATNQTFLTPLNQREVPG